MKVSLISTVYNRGKYLATMIESVLSQTYKDFELLVWEDGSTDASLEIAQHYARLDSRVKVFAAPHQGRVLALQSAHAEATGGYLGWVDSDDFLTSTALAETVAVLDAEPEVGVVYTDYSIIDAEGVFQQSGPRCKIPYSKERLLLDFMVFHFRLIRRSAFEASGGIDTSIPVAVDYDLCLRLSEVTEVRHLRRALYQYRVHSDSISKTQYLRQIYCAKEAIARALERRGLSPCWKVSLRVALDLRGDLKGHFSLTPTRI